MATIADQGAGSLGAATKQRCFDALASLEQLYEREKDWPNLAAVLEKKAALLEDPAEQSKLYQKLGSIFGDRIGDNQGAIRAWRAVRARPGPDAWPRPDAFAHQRQAGAKVSGEAVPGRLHGASARS